jgi:hypothetical protein
MRDPVARSWLDDERASAGDRLAKNVALVSATVLLGLFSFLAGLWFQDKKPWPHAHVYEAISTVVRAVKQGAILPKNVLVEPLGSPTRDAFAPEPGATLAPGYRAVMGYLPELGSYGIRLVDERGATLHRWRLDYAAIDPDGPSNGNDAPHAMHLFPDGSALVNFDHGDAMARFDACGRVMWKRAGHFHHAFGPAEDGSVWTWRGETSSEDQYQYLVRFDPRTGRTLQEIGLIEEVLATPAARIVFEVAREYKFVHRRAGTEVDDLFHPNDVEVLTAAMAPAFPGMRAGDLLLSFRNNDLVAVLDPRTKALRWHANGPWVRQHDPDFNPDGRISVYNNNKGREVSNILYIDPVSRIVTEAPRPPAARFYAGAMGKHSHTPDGRLTIVDPRSGQVLEFGPQGRLLLTLHNRYSDDFNAYVSDAFWLPTDFFQATPWTGCKRNDQ